MNITKISLENLSKFEVKVKSKCCLRYNTTINKFLKRIFLTKLTKMPNKSKY